MNTMDVRIPTLTLYIARLGLMVCRTLDVVRAVQTTVIMMVELQPDGDGDHVGVHCRGHTIVMEHQTEGMSTRVEEVLLILGQLVVDIVRGKYLVLVRRIRLLVIAPCMILRMLIVQVMVTVLSSLLNRILCTLKTQRLRLRIT
ncbi:MAG: hypothetical protein NC548_29475 [Lachnospiraceae bacterium]|nr:hypothetical protein [Lachnospiraceae bacterium]